MKKTSTIFLFLITPLLAFCQQRQDVLDYIAKYKDIAIEEMIRCKIPASITLAQGIHESSCGKSPLSQNANNHFGIKCKSDWDGKKYYKDDDAPNECFRVYKHAADSYIDHSDFLVTHSRYASLFDLPITDYKDWAYGIKAAGYATNPKYPQILINSIETYNLTQYDNIALTMMQKNEKLLNHPWPEENQMAANAVTPAPVESPVKQRDAVAEVAMNNNTSKTSAITTPPANNNKLLAATEPQKSMVAFTTPVATGNPAKPAVKQPVATGHITISLVNSRKEYIVNGIRALKAEGDENPFAIAMNYNIDFDRILAFNDMGDKEHFKDGEYIFLQAKKSRGAEPTYVVPQGESMHDISQKLGIKLKELYQKNGMKYTENEQALAGETIYLQEKRLTAPRTMTYTAFLKMQDSNKGNLSPAAIVRSGGEYQVQESDTLYSIARKFNLSVEQLKSINNLQDNTLHTGQTLVVSK